MTKADFEASLKEYSLYGSPLYKKPVGEKLTALKVFAPGNPNISLGFPSHAEVNNALQQMGFDTVTSVEEADVVILDNDQYDADLLGKKPTLIMGGGALDRLEELHVIQGFDAAHTADDDYNDYEGLLNVTVDDTNPLASGYLKDDLFYSRSGVWIEGIPEGFKPVVQVKDKDYYIAGWWANHEKLAGKILAIDGQYKDQPLFIFAGNPTNKLHTLHFYRWVSNLLLNKEHAQLVDIYQPNQTTIGGEIHQAATWSFVRDTNQWQYVKENGTTAKSEWIQYNGQWYYIKADSYMASNEWLKDNGEWYYLKSGGYMATNEWQGDFYLKANGTMAASEWVYDPTYSSWFYLKADGRYAQNEWIQYNGEWYYLKSGGYMAKSEWLWYNNQCYYLKADGSMAKNEIIQGYRVNTNGEWIR